MRIGSILIPMASRFYLLNLFKHDSMYQIGEVPPLREQGALLYEVCNLTTKATPDDECRILVSSIDFNDQMLCIHILS